MSSQPKTYLSLEEYLQMEDRSLERHEYLNGETFLMAGGTPEHSAIAVNILATLHGLLRAKDCRVRGSDAHIKVAKSGLFTYADVVVSCGESQTEGNFLINPVLIIEVLSESTENYDRGKKFELYRQIESFTEYVIVSQHRIYIEHHVRDELDPAKWAMRVVTDRNAALDLKSVDATLSISDVYEKVAWLG